MPRHVNLPQLSNDPDIPLLRFGMIGFDASQRLQIESIVDALPAQTVMWQSGAMADADARLVCGEKTRASPTSKTTGIESVRILAGLPSEMAVTLNLSQIDRPLAFSLPLHDPAMEPLFTFDVAHPGSLQTVLKEFEQRLKSLRSQHVLGKQLIEREIDLTAANYHILQGGKLLAVMDLITWKIGMLPDTDPEQFEDALWEKRPLGGYDIPNSFAMTDAAQLRWIYAQHTARNVLPIRYRRGLIYLRQPPHIPISWLSDSHLRLIYVLSKQPATLMDLVDRTGLSYKALTRDLACLYFAAALTVSPSKAAQADAGNADQSRKNSQNASGNPSNIYDYGWPPDHGKLKDEDTTVTAQLRPE